MTEQLDDQLLQELFDEDNPVGTAVLAADGQWLKVNPYLCAMFGYPEEELLKMTFQQITHPEDLQSEDPYFRRLIEGSLDFYQFKKRYLHQDGHTVWGLLNRSVIRHSNGTPRFFVSNIRDITAEMAAEERSAGLLHHLTQRLRGLFHRDSRQRLSSVH